MAAELSRFARRLVPARPDLAAAHLRGEVDAARYVEGRPMRVGLSLIDLTMTPDRAAGLATQLLPGEPFTVYDETPDGLAWGQSGYDQYVGWVERGGLVPDRPAGRRISMIWSHVYVAPGIKARVAGGLPMGADVAVTGVEDGFARLDEGGFVPARHLEPVAAPHVMQALRFLGTPYLWGGRSARGIDCSGLVQIALMAAGIDAPRDSDMQAAMLGRALESDEPAERGDFIFWDGHVGILEAPDLLLHANAHHMAVAREPFDAAVARIESAGGGPVTGRRRI